MGIEGRRNCTPIYQWRGASSSVGYGWGGTLGDEAAADGLGDEEAQDFVRMGQAAVEPAVVQVVVDGREVTAEEVLAGQLLKEAAGVWREFVFGHEFFPLVAVFVGEGAELELGELDGVLAHEGVYLTAELGEGHGFGSLAGDF